MTAPVTAGIYCRLSLARFGDTTKVEDQERICRELCERRGWSVADVYKDNNKSAWQRNRKRDGWDRMLKDVEAGRLSAIVVYHGDRLARQPFDLERLLNLSEGRGIRLASPTGERDLENGDDLFILRIEVAAACRESWSTSRRKKGQYERMRRSGLTRPGGRGGRPFCFESDGVTHVPAEAEAIRDVTEMILAGAGLRESARWLNDKGLLTTAGGPWRHGTLKAMLARPRIAGLMPGGASKAAWDPVIDRTDWEQLARILDVRAATYGAATLGRRYLLSGLAKCSECEQPLVIHLTPKGNGRRVTGYRCITTGCRKVYRSQPLLDAYVTRRTVNRLANPGNAPARELTDPGLRAEYAKLTQARIEIEDALADHTRGRLPALLARLDSLDKRLEELRAMTGDHARWRLMAAHAGIRYEEFLALALTVQRSLISAAFDVLVVPASKKGAGFRPEDVRMVPRP